MKTKQNIISKYDKWEIRSVLSDKTAGKHSDVFGVLLKNRGINSAQQKKEYLKPVLPENLDISDLGIVRKMLQSTVGRLNKAIKDKEKAVIFGDYDVDGISSTAILWEFLYGLGLDVTPYIPERFTEGYGIKKESIAFLKKEYPDISLIITVDNGIVAFDAVEKAKDLGIDTIIVDHHEKGEKYPDAYSIVHTTKLCGSAISWILVREMSEKLKNSMNLKYAGTVKSVDEFLELAVLGTVADQMQLIGANRSFVKYGLQKLNLTKRTGLNALFDISGVRKGNIGIYEINYQIAPRLNAMGRLEHAIDSLRLLCTKMQKRAQDLAEYLNRTNIRRQKVVDEVLFKAKNKMIKKKLKSIIILEDKSYHEGVIGLAASKLVDEYNRPAIVISQGEVISKGSARSIQGFNIIEAIKSSSKLIIGGGGHEMAAGFSINTSRISALKKSLYKYADKHLNKELLEKKLKIDMALKFGSLSNDLIGVINKMEPFGLGNPTPFFITRGCEIVSVKKVGVTGNHLKFKLKQDGILMDAILFQSINEADSFSPGMYLDVVYSLEENYWGNSVSLQLKIKDLKYAI